MSDPIINTLLHPAWVLPIARNGTPTGQAFAQHSVALSGNTIVAVAPRAELTRRAPDALAIELPQRLLLPGLVNAHCHAAMTLLRGRAEDVALQPWLFEHIWPIEARLMSPEFVTYGTRLAIAEMLLSGTTCFSDMYFFPEAVAAEATSAGIRCQLAFPIIEHPNAWARSADDALALGLALHEENRTNALVNIAFGPHSAYAAPQAMLLELQELGTRHNIPMQMHLHENAIEVSANLDPAARWVGELHSRGLLNPNFQAVHMTQLTQTEIQLLSQTDTPVIHCPASNMKLASGACPTHQLLDAGVRVGLGTDGAASSNSLDMLQAARLMALLAKHNSADARSVSAFEALHAATLGGAQALGLERSIGSIEPGKQADLVAFDLTHPALLPLLDPVSQLVHTEAGSKVSDVWVAGKRVVKDSALQTVDHAQLVQEADHWATKVSA